jgi:TIR domain
VNSVFISYRRDDSATMCGRIFESLEWYFGKGAVFKDVDSIPFGVPFPQYITSVLERCGVTLVVIGRRWLDVTGPDGRRRLDNPGDFVRLEIETALTRPGMLVLPLLVEGATMPPADQLPESLRPLTQLNSAVVRNDPDYQGDMRRVETAVQSALLAQGQKGSWTSGGEAGSADAAKYAPGRGNRRLLITLGALALLVAIAVPVLLATGVLSSIPPGTAAAAEIATPRRSSGRSRASARRYMTPTTTRPTPTSRRISSSV